VTDIWIEGYVYKWKLNYTSDGRSYVRIALRVPKKSEQGTKNDYFWVYVYRDAENVDVALHKGMHIIIHGRLTQYKARDTYQWVIHARRIWQAKSLRTIAQELAPETKEQEPESTDKPPF